MTVMTDVMTLPGAETVAEQIRPEDWLLLWCLEHAELDEASVGRATGRTPEQLAELRDSNPAVLAEIRELHAFGSMLNVERLFELLRQRLAALIARATKPAELRSLLGSVRLLPGATLLLKAGAKPVQPEATAQLPQILQDVVPGQLSRQQRRAMQRELGKALGK
ncbi:hypothetical protein KDL44_15450 [bacterium]|nr:hypothetical protein [bacterium]